MAFNRKLFNALHPAAPKQSTPYDPNQFTLDTAQETFRAYPSMRSAGIYMDMLILYEQDDMIEDDTWLDGLAEVRDYLLGVPRHG